MAGGAKKKCKCECKCPCEVKLDWEYDRPYVTTYEVGDGADAVALGELVPVTEYDPAPLQREELVVLPGGTLLPAADVSDERLTEGPESGEVILEPGIGRGAYDGSGFIVPDDLFLFGGLGALGGGPVVGGRTDPLFY